VSISASVNDNDFGMELDMAVERVLQECNIADDMEEVVCMMLMGELD